MVGSIPSQAQLDYTPAERKEEEVCTALKIADRLPGWLTLIPGTISEVELQMSALLGTE